MSLGENIGNRAEELAGKAKEVLGKVTGDSRTEAEGQGQQLKAKGKDALDNVTGKVSGFVDGVTGGDKQ
ncbi:CsbD family protein [Fodinicola acaciae]|uniref:CsbD family protein n=1 Tax=Fodinicola acaciae TaxID=2681555 RepID=UPI0013D70967|nr:CsbD family protein [Fodinicola acaciae]